mgnify:CR=1 FL=1
MKRVLATLAILIALVSLVMPSVAVGARGVVAHPSPTYVMTAHGHYIGGPCLLRPGKAAGCPRPDLGVLPRVSAARIGDCDPVRLEANDAVLQGTMPEPSLPPPRNC